MTSLVLHQVPLETKRQILQTGFDALVPDGTLHIADYRLQRGAIMRLLFRNGVQRLDGFDDTEPNARGVPPNPLYEAGFLTVEETVVVPTLSGSISLYQAEARRQLK